MNSFFNVVSSDQRGQMASRWSLDSNSDEDMKQAVGSVSMLLPGRLIVSEGKTLKLLNL